MTLSDFTEGYINKLFIFIHSKNNNKKTNNNN